MKPLRVLVVNQYFPPDTSATAEVFRDVVRTMVAEGNEVTVLCGRPSYQPGERIPWRPIVRQRECGALVERIGSTGFSRNQMFGRVVDYLSFFLLASIRVLLKRRPDVVLVGSDPPFVVWVGLLAARGRPVVYSLQDLHPEFALVSNMIQPGLITWIWETVHTAGLRRCATVVCLGEDMANRVERKGVTRPRIRVVHDGAPSTNGPADPQIVKSLRDSAAFTVSHCGNLGGAGAWETLIQAATRINGDSSCYFIGAGSQAELVERSGIRLLPFRPASELGSVMAAGDLQVVSLRRGMEGLVLPSKFWTALAYGRPVLAVVPENCDVARIVEEWRCGLVADPDDPDDVVKKVEWARAHPEDLAEMARRSMEAGLHFNKERSLKELVKLIEEAAENLDTARLHRA